MIPISAVLANREIMLCIQPGEHGSTFGGNPLACAVGIASLQVLKEENLAINAFILGQKLREELRAIKAPFIKQIRGKGLLNAIVIDQNFHTSAWDICIKLKEKGVLAKPTHGHIIRLAPPLIITEAQLMETIHIMREVFIDLTVEKHEP